MQNGTLQKDQKDVRDLSARHDAGGGWPARCRPERARCPRSPGTQRRDPCRNFRDRDAEAQRREDLRSVRKVLEFLLRRGLARRSRKQKDIKGGKGGSASNLPKNERFSGDLDRRTQRSQRKKNVRGARKLLGVAMRRKLAGSGSFMATGWRGFRRGWFRGTRRFGRILACGGGCGG